MNISARTRLNATSKRRALATLVMATLATLAGLAIPAPANASTISYESAKVCYVYTTGQASTITTYEEQFIGNKWVSSKAYAGTADGCRVWKVAAGYYTRFYAEQIYGSVEYGYLFESAPTGYFLAKAGGTINVGTYYVDVYLF